MRDEMLHHRQPRETQAVPVAAPLDTAVLNDNAPSAQPPAASRLGWLVFWMSGTLLSFIVAALSVRALSPALSAFEIMSIRSAGGLLILVTLAAARPELREGVKWSRMGLQATRSVVHFVSQICWTLAIAVLPFATVFALEFTIPAWIALLAVLFLGERMTLARAAALAICFVGVVVILRPGLAAFHPAALMVLGAALLYAIAAIITKKLVTTETTFAILFWMNLMQLPMNLSGSDPSSFLRLDLHLLLPALGIAVAGLAVHYCLTNAFRCGDAIAVIPMDFLRVPLIAVIGWMFYGEHLDAFVFAGAGLIVVGVLWNVRGEAQRNGQLATARPAGPPRPAIQPAE
jgi:drug/metabolite transporter (DMT)-like permease